jgi:hypothetical protein
MSHSSSDSGIAANKKNGPGATHDAGAETKSGQAGLSAETGALLPAAAKLKHPQHHASPLTQLSDVIFGKLESETTRRQNENPRFQATTSVVLNAQWES